MASAHETAARSGRLSGCRRTSSKRSGAAKHNSTTIVQSHKVHGIPPRTSSLHLTHRRDDPVPSLTHSQMFRCPQEQDSADGSQQTASRGTFAGKTVVVVGAGGAGRALAFGAVDRGAQVRVRFRARVGSGLGLGLWVGLGLRLAILTAG